MTFARQTDYYVSTSCYAPLGSSLDGMLGTFEGMSAVDAQQSIVVGTLDAVFNGEESLPVQLFEIVEKFIAYAVGTRTDYQAYNIVAAKSLLILCAQFVDRGVCVAVRLKISDVFHVGVFARKKSLSLFYLFGYRFVAVAVGGVESLVVAERTAAAAHSAIAVGTGKSCIDGYLLNAIREHPSYPFAERIVVVHIEYVMLDIVAVVYSFANVINIF